MKTRNSQTSFVEVAFIAVMLILTYNFVNGEDSYDRGGEDRPHCSEKIGK